MRTDVCIDKSLWNSIDETQWNSYLEPFYNDDSQAIRVYPGTPEYSDVVKLRYSGFIKSGYIKPTDDIARMMLERDDDSIMLALKHNNAIISTLTLNTPTERFPQLAIEMEKGIYFNDDRIQRPDVIEFVKMSTDSTIYAIKYGMKLFLIACLIAKLLEKYHFIHVSRTVPESMKFMKKFGFEYDPELSFTDTLLNNTPSCVGYCEYSSLTSNKAVSPIIRRFIENLDPVNTLPS